MAREIINGGPGESGLSARSKLNNMFEELYGRTDILITDVPGYIPEISELNDGQIMINTHDLKEFQRVGEIITEKGIGILPNFTITGFLPSEINEQSSGNSIDVQGTGFVSGMSVDIPDQNGLTFSNVGFSYIDENNITVGFDVAGNISSDVVFDISLIKSGYKTSFTMNADVDLEIINDNVSGVVGKSASEIVRFTVNENVTNFTGAESSNTNVTINSVTKISDTEVDVDLDTSAAAYEETFSIRVVADGETTPYYGMVIEDALVILSASPEVAPVNMSNMCISLTVNKSFSAIDFTNAESDNVNIVVNSYVQIGSDIASVCINTTAATEGELFGLRVTINGETSPYYAMSIDYPYIEFVEQGSFNWKLNADLYSGITGWDKTTNPVLYFEIISGTPNRVYAYVSSADRTAGIGSSVFYVEQGATTVIEQNSSGFGGNWNEGSGGNNVGDKMWCHAKSFIYTEHNEVGTPSDNVDDYEDITGWNRIAVSSLYFYYNGTTVPPISEYEIYDNETSRDNRIALDMLAKVGAFGGSNPVYEQNGSGFGGDLTADESIDGDKMYVEVS